jgi:hypothetical protein
MTTAANIPVLITADAEQRLQELGMRTELDAMLEYTKKTVPGLRAIEVRPYFEQDGTMLIITAYKDPPDTEDDPAQRNWDSWAVQAFPPEVHRWFLFEVDYRESNAAESIP